MDYWTRFDDRHRGESYHTEYIQVPRLSHGLIIGSKGQNIQELQRMNGIRHISLDKYKSRVEIVGTSAAIQTAKHRINETLSLADSYRTEYIQVKRASLGLIIGSKGRNIQELQRMDGIAHISVDFDKSCVKIDGTDAALQMVKQRIDKAESLATNDAGYFPTVHLTCLSLKCYDSDIIFDPVSQSDTYGCSIRMKQLDENRNYFVMNTNPSDSTITTRNEQDKSFSVAHANAVDEKQPSMVSHFDPHHYRPFFNSAVQANLDAFAQQSVFASVRVTFGKTFLSFVPQNAQGRALSISETTTIFDYDGKDRIRSEFASHFDPSLLNRFLTALLSDGYCHLSSGLYITAHCVSQKSEKRYSLRLRDNSDADQRSGSASTPRVEEIQSIVDKCAICTVLTEAPRCEFRTVIAIENKEVMDLDKVQEAWDSRSKDEIPSFSNDKDDWLRLDGTRTKERVQLSNGNFVLSLDTASEDYFDKKYGGLHINLYNEDVQATLDALKNHDGDKDQDVAQRLLEQICELQTEAMKISLLLDLLSGVNK